MNTNGCGLSVFTVAANHSGINGSKRSIIKNVANLKVNFIFSFTTSTSLYKRE